MNRFDWMDWGCFAQWRRKPKWANKLDNLLTEEGNTSRQAQDSILMNVNSIIKQTNRHMIFLK